MKKITHWRIVALAVLALGAASITGCATTKPIWFIATPGYVDSQIAEAQRQYDGEINALQAELDQQRAATEELAALSDVIAEVESSNNQLLELADQLEDRLAELPDETIRRLVEILQNYLDEQAAQ